MTETQSVLAFWTLVPSPPTAASPTNELGAFGKFPNENKCRHFGHKGKQTKRPSPFAEHEANEAL